MAMSDESAGEDRLSCGLFRIVGWLFQCRAELGRKHWYLSSVVEPQL
jgi:hypothetical protein